MGNYLEDILSQPDQLERLFEAYSEEGFLREKMKRLSEHKWGNIIFTGMGSSHFCAVGAGLYLKEKGIDNQVVSTGELLYYEREIIKENTQMCIRDRDYPAADGLCKSSGGAGVI